MPEKRVCKYCANEAEAKKLFCNYCGRDKFLGFKKWEYLLGCIFVIIMSSISIIGFNGTVAVIKAIIASPTVEIVQVLPTSIPSVTLPPPTQGLENIPSTPQTISTEIISTSAPVPTSCSEVTINLIDTAKGDILHIERCSDGWTYDTPLLSKGAYKLGPNNKFLIYCSNAGDVYGLKFGDSDLKLIKNLRQQMPIFRTDKEVSLVLSFIEGEKQYWVAIKDRISGQNAQVKVPLEISQ